MKSDAINSEKLIVINQSASKNKIIFKNKKKIITFVGKLNRAKGYDLFGNAIIKILKKYKDWSAYVLGDEPRDKLSFKHSRLKNFGFKEHNEVIKIYKKTSIAVVCSRWEEPFGRTSLEAPANGCAVIISNRGGLPETITNGRILKNLTINEIYKNIDPENSIVTHDAGAPRDCMVPFYNATLPNSYIGWGKTTHLGFGIPLMVGAKIAHPDKFCLNLMGDGAFGMSGLDLETSVRAELPITTVLLNNGAMSTYEGTSLIGPVSKKDYGVSSMKGNYAKIAKGMGAEGIRVEKPNEFEMALKNAQQLNKDGKTVLIDVISNVESRRSKF